MLQTIDLVKSSLNPNLHVQGILLTMFDTRNNLSHQVVDEVREHFPELTYDTVVPRNVRLSEAPSHGKPVILYGAAKSGLSHYLEGLDHKFRRDGLVVVTAKPGFVRTGMTAALDPPPFAGDPEPVAKTILRAIDRGRPVVYAPPIWRFVLLAIRMLPRALMRRLSF